ncbi:vWA domain-containing protein [Streptomyces hydrogenans]|uniref:vWA domain-containing protein n=1 Tax=Streptomyces hydrogenans TaxID=1873719 RepID=UPI00332625BC
MNPPTAPARSGASPAERAPAIAPADSGASPAEAAPAAPADSAANPAGPAPATAPARPGASPAQQAPATAPAPSAPARTGPAPSTPTPSRPAPSRAAPDAARARVVPAGEALDHDKLYTARLYAVRVRPYLATALFALRVVPSRAVPTMGVDRHWRMYVSPGFVDRTPMRELAGVWVHEVAHLLRDHHGRGDRLARDLGLEGEAERLRLNIAGDFEINDDVYGDGLPRPAGALRPEMLELAPGLLMEDYVRAVRITPNSPAMAWLDCGSGADGRDRDWELGPGGADGLTPQERAAVVHRVAQGIKGRPGSAPEAWERWAEEVCHPPQPWRELLGAAIAAAVAAGAGGDYSHRRPSRRAAALPGVVLPSLRRTPPHIAVVIDTSGSVSDTELGSALLEVAALTRAVGGRRDLVSVIACDAAAHSAQRLCAGAAIPLLGGGGTDLRAGFARALRLAPRPDVLVVFTDGQTPWPESAPPCRTIVGLFPRPPASDSEDEGDEEDDHLLRPPAWARVVEIG